ncbi:MAG TPA: hypothetical protein VNJ53_13605 [Gaiellaceae bacterium]|nr:hypothetical protein [Gaiellaceae bacterium]
MSSRSTQLALLGGLALAVAAAVAGAFLVLGGETATASKADYQAKLVNARDRVDFALERITRSQSIEELIERIDEASAVVGATAGDLDGTGVAQGFEEEHEKLVETLRRFSDELAGTAAQFSDPAFGGALEGINSLGFAEWENVNELFAELREQGVRVPPLERH